VFIKLNHRSLYDVFACIAKVSNVLSLTQIIQIIARSGSVRRPAMGSTDNAPAASTHILVDQAALVYMQNENETLHKLVI